MATRMRTDTMLPIAEKIDQVGFFSLEMWGGATFDVCIRFLAEDPWERIRTLKRHIKKTPLQMLLRGQNVVGYRNYPDDVVIKFVEKAAENGIDIFRVFDALNDIRNMEVAIKIVKKVGKHAQGSICYTISPIHTIKYYVETAKKLAELDCDSICIKDMAGMLAPQPAYELITTLKKEVGLPVHLHSHSTSGMVMMTYLRACDAGVDIIDTAFSPLACGTTPITFLTLLSCFAISKPKTKALPSVGFKMVINMLIVVVFPAPFGPRKPKISPCFTLKLTWSTAVRCLLKTLVSPSVLITSSLILLSLQFSV